MSTPLNQQGLEAEIAALPGLGLSELRERWRKVYGRPAPKFFRRSLLIRGLAYQMRVEVFGGLSEATKRRLREIYEAVRGGNEDAIVAGPRVKAGTRLIRQWKDKTHGVTVLEDGFEWQGRRYGSLSAIAKAITGTNWNGYAFFGVNRGRGSNKNAAGPRRKRDD